MGSVNSKSLVVIGSVPVTFVGISFLLSRTISDLQVLDGSEKRSLTSVYGYFAAKQSFSSPLITKIKIVLSILIPVLIYGRNAYYSIFKALAPLPQRKRADIFSFLLVLLNIYLQHTTSSLEGAFARQLAHTGPTGWSSSTAQLLITKLRNLKLFVVFVLILLLLAQRTAHRYQ